MNKKLLKVVLAWLLAIAVVLIMMTLNGCTKEGHMDQHLNKELEGRAYSYTTSLRTVSFNFTSKHVVLVSCTNTWKSPHVPSGSWSYTINNKERILNIVYEGGFANYKVSKDMTEWYDIDNNINRIMEAN